MPKKKMNRSSRKSKKTKKNINQDAIHTDSTAQQDYFVHNNVSLDDTTPKQAGCSSVRIYLYLGYNYNFESMP